MECGYCREKLEAVLVTVGSGFQVSCSCDRCGAVWTYDLYSLGFMNLAKGPINLVEPYDDADDWQLPVKHPAN